ncbi:hypothetical protein K438DRAFT_1755877 [Mycena galopus ATCC 62051]|nr:hypothetical protein K438DRAFT_1755877 [Mycena galopus ATCC 62051]
MPLRQLAVAWMVDYTQMFGASPNMAISCQPVLTSSFSPTPKPNMKPSSAWIKAAIRKTIESSMPSIRNMAGFVAIAQRAEEASDEFLDQMYHKGDLALQHCLYSRLYDSPRVELECGYFATLKNQLFSTATVALLVKQSDLELESISERAAVDILYIAFGLMSLHHTAQTVQRSFNSLFDALISSAEAAYTAYTEHKRRDDANRHRRRRAQVDLEATSFVPVRDYLQLAEEAAEPRRGPVLQALAAVSESACQEIEDFLGYARHFPAAFVTGFKSGLSSSSSSVSAAAVPLLALETPDINDLIKDFVKAPRTPSPAPIRTPSRSPRHVNPKPYLRAGAPSPPSRNHRPTPRHRARAASDPQYIYLPASPEPRLPPCTSIRCHSASTSVPTTFYATLSPPPAFARPGGPNRTLVFNPGP